jgi:hypothetical protein
MTYWNLFLDDIRFPEDVRYNYGPYDRLRICRNMDDAVWAVKQYGLPTFISFDHDLADTHYIIGDGEKTGYTFAKWLCDYIMDNNLRLPAGFDFFVHSMNPVGAENIRKYMENFLKQWKHDV